MKSSLKWILSALFCRRAQAKQDDSLANDLSADVHTPKLLQPKSRAGITSVNLNSVPHLASDLAVFNRNIPVQGDNSKITHDEEYDSRVIKSITKEAVADFKPHQQIRITDVKDDHVRCLGILNYWLDAELFDLPECPMASNSSNGKSKEASLFENEWGDNATKRYLANSLVIKPESKLVIMFQCHRAGYLLEKGEEHPNYKSPLTYLVSQAFIPKWDEDRSTITWKRSEDDADLVINLATIRTLYRRCPSAIPAAMSLSEWVEARLDSIETRLINCFDPENGQSPLDSIALAKNIKTMNRSIADEFWPNSEAQEFMRARAIPIESSFQDEDDPDAPVTLSNGMLTFRWRFCYYPDGNENTQLGPFFAEDLERVIKVCADETSAKGLSVALQQYLLGASHQTEIGSALELEPQVNALSSRLPKGRWPENPDYGLSLLQTIAVNVAANSKVNPVVSVNGPPGTGKTTLLKDIIAERFVERTCNILKHEREGDWLLTAQTVCTIMSSSMIVTSSNNKAVENISKELPSLSNIDPLYREQTQHFRSLAQPNDWGLFCAVLGNSENRRQFKASIGLIKDHLLSIKDHYQFNYFYNSLKKASQANCESILTKFIHGWTKKEHLLLIAEEIKTSKMKAEFAETANQLADWLIDLQQQKINISNVAELWSKQDDSGWKIILGTVEALKKQWYARQLASKLIKRKYLKAKRDFQHALDEFNQVTADIDQMQFSHWGLEHDEHLLHQSAFKAFQDEDIQTAESRLQQSSPFGSKSVNNCRSKLFTTALALNEALIENAAGEFKEDAFKKLLLVIDGNLETQELSPEHQKIWALLFLFFPVVSTSLASVQNQFKLMQSKQGFGLAMIDEAGQAVSYHVVGLLQRCSQAIFVGDPIQLEPVVTMPDKIDLSIASDFMPMSNKDGVYQWGDEYRIAVSSAQTIADSASHYYSSIGDRRVGIPLLVHRRCAEPMFSIANQIAYDNRMVLASRRPTWPSLPSGWLDVREQSGQLQGSRYYNYTEANTAIELVKHLCDSFPKMVEGGVFIITPFSHMRSAITKKWAEQVKQVENHAWMLQAMGKNAIAQDPNLFRTNNIGTVHTFQGKEASTVILCLAASKVRGTGGGIQWVNNKPNLINVAVTRAKHHLFVIGNQEDWSAGANTEPLQSGDMHCYHCLDELKAYQP